MKTKNGSNTKAEIELAKALLGSDLVEDHGGQFYTEDKTFYFTPTEEPVMSRAGIGQVEKPIPGRFKIAVEVGVVIPGGRWAPDEYDVEEVSRHDSLWEAIQAAARVQYEWEIRHTAQAIGEANMAQELEVA